jgi:hypothetical protein
MKYEWEIFYEKYEMNEEGEGKCKFADSSFKFADYIY